MRIKIDHRLKPYSHRMPVRCLIPGSGTILQIAPGAVEIVNAMTGKSEQLKIQVEGPIGNFTVQQEIHRGKIVVFMDTAKGYIRYAIWRDAEQIILRVDKAPLRGIHIDFEGLDRAYKKKEELVIGEDMTPIPAHKPAQLFLGSTKTQNVEGIKVRRDLKEILPFLFALSQGVGECRQKFKTEGNFELIAALNASLEKGKTGAALGYLECLFDGAFEGLFAPRSNDTDFQGLTKNNSNDSPILLLESLKSLILTLFIRYKEGVIEVLNHLPPEFPAGKLKGVVTPIGTIDLEWSKKQIKRLIIHATDNQKLKLVFSKKIQEYRLTTQGAWSGELKGASAPLRVIKKRTYIIDRFRK